MNLLRKSLWGVWAVSAIFVLMPMHVFAQYGANVCISLWTNRIESPTVNVSSTRFACVLEPVMFTARIDPGRSTWLDVACGRLRPDDVGLMIATTWVWNVRGNTAPNPSGGTGNVAVFTNNALGVGRVSFEGSGTYAVDGQTHSFTLTQDSPDFQVVDRMIAMDGNQDLKIEFNSTNDNHCTFWVNDDYDVRHWVGDGSADGWAEDDDEKEAGSIRNCDDDFFGLSRSNDCRRDLEDFTVVQLKVPSVVSNLAGITYWLKFENTTAHPSVNLFNAITNGVIRPFDYLTNSVVASNQVKEISAVTNLGSTAQQVSTNYMNRYDQPIGFLLEGRTPGKGKVTFIVKQGASEICRSSVSLELQPITNFYDVFQIGTVTHASRFLWITRTITPDKWRVEVTTNAVQVQANTAYTAESDKYLLLVHGWNMTAEDKLVFAQTAFKRMWWQKYRGGFGLYDWPTLNGFDPVSWAAVRAPNDMIHNFDDSEMIAWLSATALTSLMTSLNTGGSLRVWAHSQGNVVVGEALHKYASVNNVRTYIASQAAMGGSLYSQTATKTDFVDHWGVGINRGPETPNIMAYWYSGTNNGDLPFLSGNAAKVDRMCNYYNADDYALKQGWEKNNRWKPDGAIAYGFAYGGPINWYDEDVEYSNRFFRCGWPPEGLSVTNNTDLRTRYEVFSYCAESRAQALGRAENSAFAYTNRNLYDSPLEYDDKHYSHSREFRSNVVRENPYYENVFEDCGF